MINQSSIFKTLAARKGKVSGVKKDKLTKLVQLFDISKDPTEKNEISNQYPKIVNIMLAKLADYYVSQVCRYNITDTTYYFIHIMYDIFNPLVPN